jgi:transcriptional regulator with XRE-family HTH domain
MSSQSVAAEALRAQRLAQRHGLSQVDIALGSSVSQSQVSRILAGKASRRSRAFDRVCSYVFRHASMVSREDVRACPELLDAITEVWDGSQAHAVALAAVIRSLGALPTALDAGGTRPLRRKL